MKLSRRTRRKLAARRRERFRYDAVLRSRAHRYCDYWVVLLAGWYFVMKDGRRGLLVPLQKYARCPSAHAYIDSQYSTKQVSHG